MSCYITKNISNGQLENKFNRVVVVIYLIF